MAGIYCFGGLTAALGLVLIFSFLGPEKSEKPFWNIVQRMRKGLDRVSYLIICTIGISALVLATFHLLIYIFGG